MVQTNQFERDLTNQAQLRRPGRIDMVVFQNVPDAGDGSPGIQRMFRNYLHEGGMEKDLDVNSFDIKNVIDMSLSGEIIFSAATIHSSGAQIHIHPNTGNEDGNLIIHPIGSNTASVLILRNDVTANYGMFEIKIDGTTVSLFSGLGGAGTAPTTFNLNDSDWDNINIGDTASFVAISGVTINDGGISMGGNIVITGNVDGVDISTFKSNYDTHKASTGADHTWLDQSVVQATSPTFVGLTLSAALVTSSTVDGVDVSTFKTAYDNHAASSSNPHTVTLQQLTPGTADGAIAMGNNKITGLATATVSGDAVELAYEQSNARHGTPTDDQVHANDAERSSSEPPYSKLKETTVHRSANLRVYWEHKVQSSSYIGWTRVYVNGVAVGTEQSTASGTYSSETEDISINNGDKVQIYGWAQFNGEPWTPDTIYARYLRLKFLEYVSNPSF